MVFNILKIFRRVAFSQKQQQQHKSLLKGGAFRLNMHPRTYFDSNPYHADRPLGPPKKTSPKLPAVKPFKPSSPAKKVKNSINIEMTKAFVRNSIKCI